METAIKEQDNNQTATLVKKIYVIEAAPQTLKRFEDFLAYVQHCTATGNFITVGFGVDGDGSDQFQVMDHLPEIQEHRVRRYRHGFDIFLS